MADSLAGNVKVPVVGSVPKKAAAGGVAVVGVLIVVYYVRKKNAAAATTAAASAATATDQYPPDGTTGNPQDPYSTDPATGQTYGDESTGSGGTYGAYGAGSGAVDTGTYPWDGTTGNEADPYSLDPATGVTFGDEGLATGGTNSNPTGGPPFANNSDWENWTVQQLQNNDPGINTGDLTDALGLYLNGQPVSPAQKTLIFDATGVGGDPPVAGPNGYPPNVRTNGSTGGAEPTVTVPNVVDEDLVTAQRNLGYAGLKSTASGPKTTKAGQVRTVTKQSVAAGKKVAKGTNVALTYKIT
jgi:hypothetical protein